MRMGHHPTSSVARGRGVQRQHCARAAFQAPVPGPELHAHGKTARASSSRPSTRARATARISILDSFPGCRLRRKGPDRQRPAARASDMPRDGGGRRPAASGQQTLRAPA